VYQKEGGVYFSLPANETGEELYILNTAGQVIYNEKISNNQTVILEDQASGVYLIRYQGKTQKVIK
jgi:hypothetical protein